MDRINVSHSYDDIISVDNLLDAWKEFLRGKQKKRDVQTFGYSLVENISQLRADLAAGTYRHGDYEHFKISDPKPRDIHKASVRDRLLHHALYRKLYPLFDRTFIADSYSCRLGKGTHKALNRFRSFALKVAKNDTRTCWVHFPDHRVLRSATKRRMFRRLIGEPKLAVAVSYRGMLSHGNTHKISRRLPS